MDQNVTCIKSGRGTTRKVKQLQVDLGSQIADSALKDLTEQKCS